MKGIDNLLEYYCKDKPFNPKKLKEKNRIPQVVYERVQFSKLARDEKYTQEEIAGALNLTHSTINHYLNRYVAPEHLINF